MNTEFNRSKFIREKEEEYYRQTLISFTNTLNKAVDSAYTAKALESINYKKISETPLTDERSFLAFEEWQKSKLDLELQIETLRITAAVLALLPEERKKHPMLQGTENLNHQTL